MPRNNEGPEMARGRQAAVESRCPECGTPTQRAKTFDEFCTDFTLTQMERRELVEYLAEMRRRRTVHALLGADYGLK